MNKPSLSQVRESLTQKFLTALESDVCPWRRPWRDFTPQLPVNFKSKRQYSGMNAMLLMWSGLQSPQWGTLKAWQQSMAVEPKSSPVEIFGMTQLPYKDARGKIKLDSNGHARYYSVMRCWEVYNAQQLVAQSEEAQAKLNRHLLVLNHEPDFEPAERLISATGAMIDHRGNSAVYETETDQIIVPKREQFDSLSDYYETVFHELCHWSEQDQRVGTRNNSSYAFRELVAEMGACFMLLHIGVPCSEKMLQNSARYVRDWLKEMNNNPKYIFDAATQASKAAKFLLGFAATQRLAA
jgi:antirestriction protein ArdC